MESIYQLVLISFGLAAILAIAATRLSRLKANVFFISVFATIVGLLIGTLAYLPLSKLPGIFGVWIPVVFYVASVIAAVALFLSRRKAIEQTMDTISKLVNVVVHLPQVAKPTVLAGKERPKEILVDTSVLIDGRILDIARTGFLPGKLIVPKFILNELQNIADSAEPMRRAKGRRGLDVLNSLKKETSLRVEQTIENLSEHKAVDSKLIHLGKMRGNEVLTTDYNLNKVAQIEGVRVLNINELSQALRPVLIPGEGMELKIVQAGKEKNQGVGYLPDGTMIVIEDAANLVGETVSVEIKRVLQTAAGKMFFATIIGKNSGNGNKKSGNGKAKA